MSNYDFFNLVAERWIWDNRFLLLANLVSIVLAVVIGRNPLTIIL